MSNSSVSTVFVSMDLFTEICSDHSLHRVRLGVYNILLMYSATISVIVWLRTVSLLSVLRSLCLPVIASCRVGSDIMELSHRCHI